MSRLLLLVLLGISGFVVPSVQAAPDGVELYRTHCSVCHNEKGIGGIGLPLTGEKIEHFPRDYLFKTIRFGRPGRVMPAFDFLSDAQVNAIVDHVLSWRNGKRDIQFIKDPIEGDLARGEALFKQKCAGCHGEDGKSQGIGTGVTISREREFEVIPPALNNPGFLASASDHWIRYTISQGRPGTIMPAKGALALGDQDLNDIVAYVRSFEQNYRQQEDALADEEPTLVFDSPYDFATTVNNFKQALQGRNFRLFPERYMEMGLGPDEFVNKKQVSLRFCNFAQLYKMINTEPRLGVVLPCRITIVENADGEVKLYVMNMKLVSRLYNNDQLNGYADTMMETVLEVIDEATL